MRLRKTNAHLPYKVKKVNVGSIYSSKKKFLQRMDKCYEYFYLSLRFLFVLIFFNVTILS